MRLLMAPTDTTLDAPRLTLSFAATREEVREAQRLRYKVFVEAAGLPRPAHHNGLDQDEFDQYCDHLIVRDSSTSQVVGTYRVLGPDAARRRGRSSTTTAAGRSRAMCARRSTAGFPAPGRWRKSSSALSTLCVEQPAYALR